MVDEEYVKHREYLEQFRNRIVLERLRDFSEDQFNLASRIHLSRTLKYLERKRRKIEEKDDYRDCLSEGRIECLYKDVKERCNTVLGVEDVKECHLNLSSDLSSRYKHYSKTIILRPEDYSSWSELGGAVAHEYSHHLLFTYLKCSYTSCFEYFHEGYSMGVGRIIFGQLQQKDLEEDDGPVGPRNLYLESPSLEVFSRKLARDLTVLKQDEWYIYGNKHSLGNALFAALEAERGPDIYRQILHGEFKW